jgi:hypothetical protein
MPTQALFEHNERTKYIAAAYDRASTGFLVGGLFPGYAATKDDAFFFLGLVAILAGGGMLLHFLGRWELERLVVDP